MDLTTWLLFVATEAALCASPGPAVLYVASQGLSRGFWPSVAGNLGIVSGNIVYFAASAVGLGSLILASHELFLVIKWCAVIYLIFLGLRLIVGASKTRTLSSQPQVNAGKIYKGGLLLQLANPKNLIFFIAILPPFIDSSKDFLIQILILGITSQFIEFFTLLFYGALSGGFGQFFRQSQLVVWINRISGSMLVSIGIGYAWLRRADA